MKRRGTQEWSISFGQLCTLALVWGLPMLAGAQTSPFETGANSLVTTFITLATPIAILVVMALGIAAIVGRISWGWAIGAVIGIAVIFGANTLITWIRGLFGV